MRFEDLKKLFESQAGFSPTSAVAKRVRAALEFLASAFPEKEPILKTRTIVQTLITFVCKMIETGKSKGLEGNVATFIKKFMAELIKQVELGQTATDYDFIRFQKSVNANVKAGSRIRQEILLRKAFLHDAKIADAFDSTVIASSGVNARVKELGEVVADQVGKLNFAYSAKHGHDLFKSTNKTTQAIVKFSKPIGGLAAYKQFIDDLYFVFHEGVGNRLGNHVPESFKDIKSLRTGIQHDVDHGDNKKVSTKNKSIGGIFAKYAGAKSPEVLDESRFVIAQANILTAIELDLKNLAIG